MKIVEQQSSFKEVTSMFLAVEGGCVCYNKEPSTVTSDYKYLKPKSDEKHDSIFEHVNASVVFKTDIRTARELMRHRHCAYSQRSTRYVREKGDIRFIKPYWFDSTSLTNRFIWKAGMWFAEKFYMLLSKRTLAPQQCGDLLPLATETEVMVTTNLREWKHIYNLRVLGMAGKPHPQITALVDSIKWPNNYEWYIKGDNKNG